MTLAKFLNEEKIGLKNLIDNETLFNGSENVFIKHPTFKKYAHPVAKPVKPFEAMIPEERIPIISPIQKKRNSNLIQDGESRPMGIAPYSSKKVDVMI